MTWAGQVVLMGEKRNVYKLLIRKPEGKSPLGKLRPFRDGIGYCGLEWSDSGWVQVERAPVKAVMNFRVS
jgi:hypothetical protein